MGQSEGRAPQAKAWEVGARLESEGCSEGPGRAAFQEVQALK